MGEIEVNARSRATTLPSGLAIFQLRTYSAVSCREIEVSVSGLESRSRRVGMDESPLQQLMSNQQMSIQERQQMLFTRSREILVSFAKASI
jgi:hypothetical protein